MKYCHFLRILSISIVAAFQATAQTSPIKIDFEKTEKGSGQSILANDKGEYGGGVLLGRPISSYVSWLFGSYELAVNQGGFLDSNAYLGSSVHLSTDSKEVFELARKIDPNKMYVFEYKQINPFDPEIESSHYQVTGIHTPEEYLKKREVKEIPGKVESGDSHSGMRAGYKRGRVVDVHRYGFFDNFCWFELNVGGLSSGGEGGSEENIKTFTVMDEKICSHLEDIIALGKDVEVGYEEDFLELWQPTSRYCKSIKCIQHEPSAAPGIVSEKVSEIDQIKGQLLTDPEFLKALEEALQKMRNQNRSRPGAAIQRAPRNQLELATGVSIDLAGTASTSKH